MPTPLEDLKPNAQLLGLLGTEAVSVVIAHFLGDDMGRHDGHL